jgi:hypothetical protein
MLLCSGSETPAFCNRRSLRTDRPQTPATAPYPAEGNPRHNFRDISGLLSRPYRVIQALRSGATRLLPRIQDTGEANAKAVGIGESKIA